MLHMIEPMLLTTNDQRRAAQNLFPGLIIECHSLGTCENRPPDAKLDGNG